MATTKKAVQDVDTLQLRPEKMAIPLAGRDATGDPITGRGHIMGALLAGDVVVVFRQGGGKSPLMAGGTSRRPGEHIKALVSIGDADKWPPTWHFWRTRRGRTEDGGFTATLTKLLPNPAPGAAPRPQNGPVHPPIAVPDGLASFL